MYDATNLDPIEVLREQERRIQRLEGHAHITNAKQFEPDTIGAEGDADEGDGTVVGDDGTSPD